MSVMVCPITLPPEKTSMDSRQLLGRYKNVNQYKVSVQLESYFFGSRVYDVMRNSIITSSTLFTSSRKSYKLIPFFLLTQSHVF